MSSQLPLQTFHFFPKLPTEIRLQIWRFVPEPRVVQLRHTGRCDSSGFVSDSAEPSLLHVNRESREVGLSIYELAFRRRTAYAPCMFPATVYFNYALDTAYFCKQECCDPLWPWVFNDWEALAKLKRLAISQSIFHSVSRFRCFNNLEEVILVFEDPKFHIRGDVKLERFPPLEPRKRYAYSQHQEAFYERLVASLEWEDSQRRSTTPKWTPPKVSIKALVGLAEERPRAKPSDNEFLRSRLKRNRNRWRNRPRKVVGSKSAHHPKQVGATKRGGKKEESRPIRHPATAPYNLRSTSRRK